MSTVQLPAPPQQKRRVWLWVLGAIVLLVAVSTATADTRNAPEPPATVEPVDPPVVEIVSAVEFVDFAFTPAELRNFCTAYFGLGNDDVAFRAFESGAGPELYDASMPTHREVFDELVWRCVS